MQRAPTACGCCARRRWISCAAVKPLYRKSIVSLLWPDEIRIALCRDRAILARISGRGRNSSEKHIQACDSATRSDWRPALRAATDALGELGWKKGRVTFI